MKKSLFSLSFISIVILLSGCAIMPGSGTSVSSNPVKTNLGEKAAITSPTSVPNSTSSVSPSHRTEVVWSDYDPGVQTDIDLMTSNGDCLGIQSFFGMATATEESVKARTGHGNEALTKYLNESLALAQCN